MFFALFNLFIISSLLSCFVISLTSEQIANYFLEKKMVNFEYCVKFNDKQSPWWDESYIQVQ